MRKVHSFFTVSISLVWKLFCFGSILFFTSCGILSEDILTARGTFANSCLNSARGICINYYPEDGEEVPCSSNETIQSDQCDTAGVLAECGRTAPPDREAFYYESGWSETDAQVDCTRLYGASAEFTLK